MQALSGCAAALFTRAGAGAQSTIAGLISSLIARERICTLAGTAHDHRRGGAGRPSTIIDIIRQ